MFDVNDFDETLPGPWEWDVKRLGVSMLIAARDNDYADRHQDQVVLDTVEAYRSAMAGFAAMAVYALCVWPANFKHAIDGIDLPYVTSSWLYHGPRLALQPVIIWWALYCANVIDWPWPNHAGTDSQ